VAEYGRPAVPSSELLDAAIATRSSRKNFPTGLFFAVIEILPDKIIHPPKSFAIMGLIAFRIISCDHGIFGIGFAVFCSGIQQETWMSDPHSTGCEMDCSDTPLEKTSLSNLRVAVVHDWLVTFGGAERVLQQILRLFPRADLFALCDFLDDRERAHIFGHKARTSFIQRLPLAKRKYRSYLPLMPMAAESFDLSGYDLIISSSHAVARGVITNSDQTHIAYINNTMIYAWDMRHHYLRSGGLLRGPGGLAARLIMHYIRTWDGASAPRVDHYIANSEYMARRIEKLYRRPSTVIYPPVDVNKFELYPDKEDYYIAVSRLVPFKRIDLVVDAFRRMPDRRLIILGDGPDMKRLRRAAGSNITFLGFSNPNTVREYVKQARAFLFPSEEPFGIAAVEAQACGTPVIAYNRGASCEIVADGETGIFFDRQHPDSLIEAIDRFERIRDCFDPARIRESALRFSVDAFRSQFAAYIEDRVNKGTMGENPNGINFRNEQERISMPVGR
jgi:glycosyltransferase involved in cell wall biosynthesis